MMAVAVFLPPLYFFIFSLSLHMYILGVERENCMSGGKEAGFIMLISICLGGTAYWGHSMY